MCKLVQKQRNNKSCFPAFNENPVLKEKILPKYTYILAKLIHIKCIPTLMWIYTYLYTYICT